MPMVSKKQWGFMFKNHPELAHEMAEKNKTQGKPFSGLPERATEKMEEPPDEMHARRRAAGFGRKLATRRTGGK